MWTGSVSRDATAHASPEIVERGERRKGETEQEKDAQTPDILVISIISINMI